MAETSIRTQAAQPEASLAFEASRKFARAADWSACLASFAQAVAAGAMPDATALLYRAIARIRSEADPLPEIAALDPGLVASEPARLELRRLVASPFVRENRLEAAAAVLALLAQARPDRVDDRRLLASVLGRLRRWDEAIAHADTAAAVAPQDATLQLACIQLRLQAGRNEEAAQIAQATLGMLANASESAHVWMTAFIRGGDSARAAYVAALLDPKDFPNERVAASAVQALLADDRIEAAIAAGECALDAGHDGAPLRSHLGQAYLARGTDADRTERALEHFAAGVALAPSDLRLVSLHGETLMRAGRYADAIEPLKKASRLAPELEQPRALLARAQRYAGRHGDAAEELMELVRRQPRRVRWQRSAVAALSQAGRKDEATTLYASYLETRASALPETFAQAFAQLEHKLDSAPIPQARFDWAWSLRRGEPDVDRAQWERAGRWGYLADHLLLEWLECRDDRIEEAMGLLGNLDEADRFFAPFCESGKGFIVATAHVGPMYAGLMTLELLGIRSRWLSTTPSVTTASYASALISTADQTEAQVAKECLRALQGGNAVCLAVEGAPNPAAPRIPFEGQTITYSSFASRAAHRLGAPSIFYAPRWENGKIVQTLAMLPAALPGEDIETYVIRWQQAYLALLREHLAGPPENLRLSGGIWRHVRPLDRSAQAQAAPTTGRAAGVPLADPAPAARTRIHPNT